MLIANPIYDVVFKYLLDDNKIAKLILSLILKRKILKLEFKPSEVSVNVENSRKGTFVSVFRLDFSAKIKNDDGSEELVIIEVQKAKLATDIMRFRNYLATQYGSINNYYETELKRGIKKNKKAMPIISIYFLGHSLDFTKAPAIKVDRTYIDISTDEHKIINVKEEFIESLTHDSYIIQIPHLPKRRQSDLLKVLSVFDQNKIDNTDHILNIREEDLPEKYRTIIRRLQKAISDKEMQDKMTVEDEIVEVLKDNERVEQELAEDLVESKRIINENKKVINEKVKVINENKKVIDEKEKVIDEKEKVIKIALKLLISQGMSEKDARQKLGL